MFQYQINRVKENILPFFWIGIIVGFVIAKSDYLKSISWLNSYLAYANVEIDYKMSVEKVFFEHFAPNTLLFLLIAIFGLSAIHRIIWGALEKTPNQRIGIIYSLENFASLLAIAWLGLMLGIIWPALIFEGVAIFFKFAFLSIYPIIFLVEVSICTTFLYWEGFHKPPKYRDGHQKWKIGTRLEGFFILALAILMFTYRQQYDSMMKDIYQFFISWL